MISISELIQTLIVTKFLLSRVPICTHILVIEPGENLIKVVKEEQWLLTLHLNPYSFTNKICIIVEFRNQGVERLWEFKLFKYFVIYFFLEQTRIRFTLQHSIDNNESEVNIPHFCHGSKHIPTMKRYVISLIGMDMGIEPFKELRVHKILCLIQFQNQLVYLVEVQKWLRDVEYHFEILDLYLGKVFVHIWVS